MGFWACFSLLDSPCMQPLGQLNPTLPSPVPRKSMWNGHEDLLKRAFVQLGTGTALLLCITLKRELRDLSYNRETQRRSSTKKPNPGQRFCLAEIAKNPDFPRFLHSSSSLGPELSSPPCKSFTGMLKRETNENHRPKLTCLQLLQGVNCPLKCFVIPIIQGRAQGPIIINIITSVK